MRFVGSVLLRALVLVTLVALFTGCTSLHYLTQAAAGQEQLNQQGISIQEIVDGNHLDKRTREVLAHVPRIKAFGERYGLRHTNNYERYINIKRPAVVWVVSACHPLAFRPRTWKFPIVGSITYTGWFDEKEARAYSDQIRKQGWDVDVRPSQAYSTLGWFDDPILSTMLAHDEAPLGDLADVILHETLHATFFVPGQSTLNESVASFVGDTLAEKYLEEAEGPDSWEKLVFLGERERGEKRGEVMKKAYEELAALYASKKPRAQKLAEKKQITDTLRAELRIRRPVTNATLIQYKTYGSGKDELRQLYAACGAEFPRFMRAMDRLRPIAAAAPPHSDPAILLRQLLAGGC